MTIWGVGKKWKSLLQAQFHSVNYCQYNISEPRTLIYVLGSLR